MVEKITKEHLQIELAKIRHSHEGWVSADDRRRKEFAKAFSWRKPQEMYSPRDNEPATPTWEQIFVEVGKLIAARNFMDYEGNISEIEFKLEDLEKRLLKNVNPNL